MADAVATPTVTQQWFDGKRTHVIGTIAVSASPATYATGGIVCDFTGLVKGNNSAPQFMQVLGQAGFIYRFVAGATVSAGKFMIFVENTVGTNSPLAQHTVAAIGSGVSGDTINFYGIFDMGH